MNVRKLNLSLWTLAAVLAAGALLSAALALLLPVEVAYDEQAAAHQTRPATSQASPDAQLPLQSFAPVWALNLRRPLSDSPPATNTNTQVENPGTTSGSGAPFILVGTIGDSLAMVSTASGVVELKGVGEQAHGAKIIAIRPAQVDIEMGGARMTVTKPREPGGG